MQQTCRMNTDINEYKLFGTSKEINESSQVQTAHGSDVADPVQIVDDRSKNKYA